MKYVLLKLKTQGQCHEASTGNVPRGPRSLGPLFRGVAGPLYVVWGMVDVIQVTGQGLEAHGPSPSSSKLLPSDKEA